ncbi:MAG: hypothetical protein R2939_19360 [Kofleriaceae bacterium]
MASGDGAPRPDPSDVEPLPSDAERDNLTDVVRQKLEAIIPEIVKRTFAVGVGAMSSTEEGIRRLAKEAKDVSLPDVAGYLASSADATKDKVFEVIARETRDFLEKINLGEEIAKMLTTLSFEVKTEIRFIPNSERYSGVEPEVKAAVKLKRADSKGGDGKP